MTCRKLREATHAVLHDVRLIDLLESRVLFSIPNLTVADGAGVQQNPSSAVDPTDSKHLVVSYMDNTLVNTGYAGIGVAVSEDGGTTWQKSTITLPANFQQGAATPVTQFDDQGHVFVSFSAATFSGSTKPALTDPDFSDRALGLQSNNGIFVARSDDGGDTFSTPVAVVSHIYNGTDPVLFESTPDLAVDTFATLPNGKANPNFGNLYEVWTRSYTPGTMPGHSDFQGGTDGMIAVSKDHGKTWTIQTDANGVTSVDDPVRDLSDAPPGIGYIDQVHDSVGPQGDIYVSDYGGGDFSVLHSTDAGKTFAAPDHNTSDRLAFGTGFLTFANSTMPNNQFRTNTLRDVVADPSRPGVVYALDTIIDTADGQPNVYFARSSDYGVHWSTDFTVGGQIAKVLDDENGGQVPTGDSSGQVVSSQAMARLSVDANGDIAVIWYDTRVDPANHLLDLFGTVSTDGGKSFSSNFRITNQSFDANNGVFTDGAGNQNYYLGDFIGLSTKNGNAFATWTDTSGGSQDIQSAQFSITNPPTAANDRFEPNQKPSTATNLGNLLSTDIPKLNAPAGDQDWYQFTTSATGQIDITATQATAGDQQVQLELYDATGKTLLATGTNTGGSHVTGQEITAAGTASTTYLLRVTPVGSGGHYSLHLQCLTADLGTRAFGRYNGTLATGDQNYVLLTAPASGSLDVTLTPGSDAIGTMSLEILNADGTSSLATGSPATITVSAGTTVLLHVSGDSSTSGSYKLQFTNLDQNTAAASNTLVPAGSDPSQTVVADVNGDGKSDLIVAGTKSDTVRVLLGNGDGTFQAPREYSVGSFSSTAVLTDGTLPSFKRAIAVADFNHDGIPDIVVTNYDSGDVSVLLGNGDGTFQPQRRFNAVANPFDLAVGDVNGDGIPDIAVVSANTSPGLSLLQQTVGVLLGRGDGTFLPPKSFNIDLPTGGQYPISSIRMADLNGDGKPDLVVSGDSDSQVRVFLGNGDGTFRKGTAFAGAHLGGALLVADVDGDGKPDVVNASFDTGLADVFTGNGDGTFTSYTGVFPITAGQGPVAMTLADLGSVDSNGNTTLTPDGHGDLVFADSGANLGLVNLGPASVAVAAANFDSSGAFQGFGFPTTIYTGIAPTDVTTGDFNGDGVADVAITDSDGIHIVFGATPTIVPNDSPSTPTQLGTVVHLAEPTLSIVPGHTDAYFHLTAPTEAATGAGDEVMDFSALFSHVTGAGLTMDITDADGNVLASGDRARVQVAQGESLTVHIHGAAASSYGAYTLDIDTLPQIVSIAAPWALPGANHTPGGPTTSMVVTFQGDRLDPSTAQDPSNYTVTWAGPDGKLGTSDDQNVPLGSGNSAVYNSSANVNVTSGKTYATAVRQTVTLLFDKPLEPGSYKVTFSSNIIANSLSADETSTLAGTDGHSLVSFANGKLIDGAKVVATDLVQPATSTSDFSAYKDGTPFLTQLQNDLNAELDAALSNGGDSAAVTAQLLAQIEARYFPALQNSANGTTPLMIMFLDPVSLALTDPNGQHINYNLQSNQLTNQTSDGYVSVSGNVEVVVMPAANGNFQLDLSDVPETARGGVVLVGQQTAQAMPLTDEIRGGQTQFQFGVQTTTSAVNQSAIASATRTGSSENSSTTDSSSGSASASSGGAGTSSSASESSSPASGAQYTYLTADESVDASAPVDPNDPKNKKKKARPADDNGQPRHPTSQPWTAPTTQQAQADPAPAKPTAEASAPAAAAVPPQPITSALFASSPAMTAPSVKPDSAVVPPQPAHQTHHSLVTTVSLSAVALAALCGNEYIGREERKSKEKDAV